MAVAAGAVASASSSSCVVVAVAEDVACDRELSHTSTAKGAGPSAASSKPVPSLTRVAASAFWTHTETIVIHLVFHPLAAALRRTGGSARAFAAAVVALHSN